MLSCGLFICFFIILYYLIVKQNLFNKLKWGNMFSLLILAWQKDLKKNLFIVIAVQQNRRAMKK